MENIKNKIICIGFVLILSIILIINIITKDELISIAERRKLNQFPQITFKNIINGEVTKKWENYATDQFVQRDLFRKIKAIYSFEIIKQKDNNKLYEVNGGIYKMEYPLKSTNVEKSAKKINNIYNKYLKNMNVYYSIIPDKSYYLENDNHLKLDFEAIEKIMNNNLCGMKYIDISDDLHIEDFYKTDLHWKQENLENVANEIQNKMGVNAIPAVFEKQDMGEFYGSYYGQFAIDLKPDKIYILNNENINNCKVYNYETQQTTGVYNQQASYDKYDTYLYGATPLITIDNLDCNNEKELLIFRDSFASSLAPLLIQNYRKITLIDTRYMSSDLLEKYIKFENQDVLFVYSCLVLNEGILR